MRTVIATVILLLCLLLVVLVVYILLRRAGGGIKSAYTRRRHALLEAAMNAWLADPAAAPPIAMMSPRPFIDLDLLADLCMSRLPLAAPEERERLLGWLGDSGLIAQWIRQLKHRSSWKRAGALERLAVLKLHSCVDVLVEMLEDPAFDVRMRAAKALGSLGGEPARKALVGALRDENRWSVIRIADLLGEMGPGVVDDLIEAYPGMARASRLAALDLIAASGELRAAPFLLPQLDDLDRDIRARAASALGEIGDPRSVRGLTSALQDPEWPVRAMAAKALGQLGVEPSAAPLAAALRDREWWVRANAAEALRRLGARGLEQLVTALDDSDRFARDQALAILESSGELERRLAKLVATDPNERQRAHMLLQVLLARQTRLRIESIRARQSDENVKQAIDHAMLSPGIAVAAAR